MTRWHDRWMAEAGNIATWSKDPRTKVGAVAVKERHRLMDGYNGLPAGVIDDPCRMLPDAKYDWTLHAEANVIAKAAKHGVSLDGATVYVTHKPCCQCAALLINAGVRSIIYGDGRTNMPDHKFEIAGIMCSEAEVSLDLLVRSAG